MNLTDLISDIKDSEGLDAIALPFNEPVETVIVKVLGKSVRTFSDFKRQKKELDILIKDLKSPSEEDAIRNIYLLPAELTTTNVKDVYGTCQPNMNDYKGHASMNVFTVGSPFVGWGSYYPQDILNAQQVGAAINKYAGVSSRQPTVKYLGYNKIQLFDYPKNSCIHLIVECEHDISCETIPESCRESFIELATLDVEIFLYSKLRNMTNVGSGYKEIQLKIDDWAGAKDKRAALIKQWTDTWYLDDVDNWQFM